MSEHKPKPPIFHKLRRRAVEEIAIQMVVDMISPDGGDLMVPADWMAEAETLRKDLLMMLSDETNEQRRPAVATKKVKHSTAAEEQKINSLAWDNPCTNFRSIIGDENTCKTCGWRKQNHHPEGWEHT